MARVKMGLKSLDDDRGFARGCGHYTNSESFISTRRDDYQFAGPGPRDIWERSEGMTQPGPGSDTHGYHEPRWRSGPLREKSNPGVLSGDHKPKFAPKGDAKTMIATGPQKRMMTNPRNQANSQFTSVAAGARPTGKFAKRPGRAGSQRSGA